VLDHRTGVSEIETGSFLILDLPRERLESALGPLQLTITLAVGANLASTMLVNTYVQKLIRVRDHLNLDGAARMAVIGVELVVASLAERFAREVPRSIHGNATVQRAKAYIETHLSDTTLDPPQLAAVVGVSLRRLQELFHERGRHISDYIRGRRLEVAAQRLSDPACAHLSIGMLAYGCGFSSQAHFPRRFKDRYDMNPREYRQAHRRNVQSVAFALRLSSSLAE
jgi:AraC family transcriptional regulator, positive regulator of tynA and feaB